MNRKRSHFKLGMEENEELKIVTCMLCTKNFRGTERKRYVKAHLRIHTGADKQFRCEFCDKAFFEIGPLNSHLKIHSEEGSFKCDYCEKKFNYKGNLKRHLTIHTRNLEG